MKSKPGKWTGEIVLQDPFRYSWQAGPDVVSDVSILPTSAVLVAAAMVRKQRQATSGLPFRK